MKLWLKTRIQCSGRQAVKSLTSCFSLTSRGHNAHYDPLMNLKKKKLAVIDDTHNHEADERWRVVCIQ